MRFLGKYIKPYTWRIAWQLTVKLGGSMIELLIPGMLSTMLDEYAPVGDMQGVWMVGLMMLFCAAMAWGGNIYANKMSTNISRRITHQLRRDLFDKVQALSAAQRDKLTDSSIISRLTSDTYNVHQMIDRMQRLGVRAPILLIGGMIVALTLEPVLTLVMAASLPLLGVVIVTLSRKGVPLFTKVQQAQDVMVRKVQENMAGARVIRALSRTAWEREDFERISGELIAKQRTADVTMAKVGPTTSFLLNAELAAVVLVGAFRVNAGVMQPGKIIAFLSYFTIILNALLMVSRLFVMYSKGSASARRLGEVFALEPDMPLREGKAADEEAHIVFDRVSFSYNKNRFDVEDISFTLKHGETLGVIGPTGSGKSTLLSLLLRQYDPDQGEIRMNGQRLDTIPLDVLHDGVGVVFQNDFLMADTLRDNIRFGREVADDDIIAAADCAQAGFIRKKEGVLDFLLNVKGRNLSGGQQQRVLITRALAADPQLLLLDDCSSALDYKTDRALRRALRQRHGDATTVLIAQRVSAVMAADHILVMDGGRMVGYGTHETLKRDCPLYHSLCKLQLGEEEYSHAAIQ